MQRSARSDDDIVVDELPARPRSLRVAIVTETYPPEVNGVALTVVRLVEGLHARYHDLQLVRPRQKQAGGAPLPVERRFDEVLTGGMPIPRYPSLRMGVPSKRALVQLWSLRRPDVVHIATEGPLGWSALQAARHLKLPVTSDFRTNFHAYGRHYGIGWLAKPILAYLRKFHNRTRCTMVPTEALRSELAARGFERLEVVGRGVDARRFDPARRSEALRAAWGADADTLVALYVGRLAPEKNLVALIVACEALQSVHARVRLVLVGDGPMRGELQRRCPQAVFAGHRSGNDLATHYASGDLFLFPSQTETYGNVTSEAMASGLPVVAFDHAAAGQWIQSGRNGVLAQGDDDAAFVRAALSLVGDGDRLRAIGEAARETALRADWERVIVRFEALLSRAIDDEATTMPLPALRLRSS